MTEAASRVADHAAQLRRDFDSAFAEPASFDTAAREDLLAIRIGAQPYAIRVSEIAGLYARKKITRVPGGSTALRGIAGFRGALLPVYDLAAVLGLPAVESPRWLVIAVAAPAALAFESFQGQLRAARDEILPQATRPDASGYARDVVRTKDFVGPVLHLASVLDALGAPRSEAIPLEEQ